MQVVSYISQPEQMNATFSTFKTSPQRQREGFCTLNIFTFYSIENSLNALPGKITSIFDIWNASGCNTLQFPFEHVDIDKLIFWLLWIQLVKRLKENRGRDSESNKSVDFLNMKFTPLKRNTQKLAKMIDSPFKWKEKRLKVFPINKKKLASLSI